MSRVLITYDSRFGSTGEVARTIAEVLRARGLEADVHHVDETFDPTAYDAVVIGSPLYSRRWLPGARRFLARHRELLATRRVWYFALGIRMPGAPQPNPDQVTRLKRSLERIGRGVTPRGWGLFPGRLDPTIVGWWEKIQLRLFKPQTGDFRDWSSIRSWADAVASDLSAGR